MNYTYNDVVKRIKKCGFSLKREARGSHEIWMNTEGVMVVIPNHPGRNISKGVIKEIINDLGLTNEAFKNIK